MRITGFLFELLLLPFFLLELLAIYTICWIFAYFTSWITTISILVLLYWYITRESIPTPEEVKERKDLFVVIVGTGFAGISAAIRFKQERIPFIILDKSTNIGGTWWDNQFPGCACDVRSHVYCISQFPNPFWSKSFPKQGEIVEYFENLCEYYDLYRYIQLNTKVEKCEFDETTKQWTVSTSTGKEFKCNFLISGVGTLRVPKIPDIPGKDNFLGESFHTALWNKDYSLDGKTVGIIGTGATAVQVVPSIAPKLNQLYVFQRTPIWVVPKFDYNYHWIVTKCFQSLPFLLRFYRLQQFLRNELLFLMGFISDSEIANQLRKFVEFYMKQQLDDPSMHKKMIPDYPVGTKRTGLSSDYLSAFNRGNVTLVDAPIQTITKTGIKVEGKEEDISLDAIIYATGYDPNASYTSFAVHRPEDGRTLAGVWGNCPTAYYGMMYPGFPNYFMLLGPNTTLGK